MTVNRLSESSNVLHREDIDEAAMRLLPYMRSVTLRQFDGTVVTKIRPGYQYYVSYRKTTSQLINTPANPCVTADTDRVSPSTT